MKPKIAVILVNYKRPEYTIACLQSLYRYCDPLQFDVIVVDNASGDGSLEKIRIEFPNLTYFEEKENLGFAEGNNVALRMAISKGYEYSLIINNDTIIDEDLLEKLTGHLETHPGTVAVQPAIFWMHKPGSLWNGPGYFNKWLGKTYNKNDETTKQLQHPVKADWLTGCCILVRNDMLNQCGLFNGRFFLYYEDVDLSYRLRQFGNLDYLPTSKLYHEAGASAKSSTQNKEGTLTPVIHYYVSRNHLWVIRRYGSAALYPINLIYNLGFYFSLLSYFILRGRNQKAGYLWRGIKEGLFTPISSIWANG